MSFVSSRRSLPNSKNNLLRMTALWMLVLDSVSNSFLCGAFQTSVMNQRHISRNLWFQNVPDQDDDVSHHPAIMTKDELRRDWVDRSRTYYSKVMRRRQEQATADYQDAFTTMMAMRHYFALRKIKEGKTEHALVIYRKIIDEHLMNSCTLRTVAVTPPPPLTTTEISFNNNQNLDVTKDHCDHATLATTTLLLALALQRTGASPKKTRSVFLKFFRVIAAGDALEECACSAKVMGAFALFEMKQGNTLKSYQLAHLAWQLDPTVMQPLLHWKQFRDAASSESPTRQQPRRLVFKPNASPSK